MFILFFAVIVGSAAYLFLGAPTETRKNTLDEIVRFRPRVVSGIVQYTGGAIAITILVYMAHRWLRLRL